MINKEPTAELDSRLSSDDATPIPWAKGRERLEEAEVYWISAVRPDGRTSRRCWPSGWTARCTSPPVRTNARRRTSCVTPTVSSQPRATRSTWWSNARQ
jgi:hypothetical protein